MDNPDVMMYGAINSLRTGNIVVDMAVVFIIPYIFKYLLNFFQQIVPQIWHKIDKMFLRYYRRQIIHVQDSRGWMEDKSGYRNNLLIHAVRQYIGHELKTHYPVGSIKLSGIKSKSSTERGSAVNQLESFYKVLQLPQLNTYVEIEPGLWYCEVESVQGNDDGEEKNRSSSSSTVTTMTLMANRRGGKAKVDAFVDRAYEWYTTRVESMEDHSRFMYQPLVKDKYASSDDKQKPRIYKRYKLSGEKSFRSLFFPEKDRLLHIIDLFVKKEGKYAIKGFPHKLGLLLHGPPGTGKTSLVKAIAEKTGRHIVSVPLSRIHTNQELMDVMFDQLFNFKAPGKSGDDDDDGGTNNRLSFKDVIFLMEDVDAATKIVHARKKKKVSTNARALSHALERQYTEASAEPSPEAGAKNKAMEEKLRKQKEMLEQQQAMLDAAKASKKDKDGDKKDSGDGSEDKAKDIYTYEKDKLNLAGLLTVLDGIVDAPERILIMTTNHPEKLDPALIRPGRVNMQIYMGFIKAKEAIQMAHHYYGGLTPAEDTKIQKVFDDMNATLLGGFKMSPAEMEQKCAECDNVDQLVESIRAKGEKAKNM